MYSRCLFALMLSWCLVGIGQEKPEASYFQQDVAASNALRSEQAKELDAYINSLKRDTTRLATLFQADYASPMSFEKSTEPLRKAFCESIGFPPPGDAPEQAANFDEIGDDAIGTYYRAFIPVLPGVHAEGIYIVPKGIKEKAPLVIAMHGGGGSPEVAIAKITRSLDVLLKRPEVDADRVAMVGLSYGGYYALVAPAVDTRIKVAVCSCYYGVQEGRYERDELSIPSDFRFPDRFSLFRDSELVALICPRALQIQAGNTDGVDHRDAGKLLAPKSASYYEALHLSERFQHLIFPGGHEFHDASAWDFVKKHL